MVLTIQTSVPIDESDAMACNCDLLIIQPHIDSGLVVAMLAQRRPRAKACTIEANQCVCH